MNDFFNKNFLIIGASSGIGNVIAQQLLEQKGTVYSASRHKPSNLDVPHFEFDASAPNLSFISELPDVLHGVVYCPGTINLKPFQRLSQADFLHDFQVNVLGAIAILQATNTQLRKAKGASVVMFSTVAVKVGLGFHASVAASKGAIEGLGKSLSAEWAASQIRVNVIAPSLTDTPLASQLLSTPEKQEASNKRHPLGRFGAATDSANLATFLLSDAASWMTGQVIGVDGGLGNLR